MEFGPDTLDNPDNPDSPDTLDTPDTPDTLDDLDNLDTLDNPATPVDVAERADLALEDDRLAENSPEEANAITPRHLSPSSSSLYRQCSRKWKFRYVDRLADPPGEAALAGTFAHRVLELLLQLPAAKRTKDEARRLARAAWPEMARDLDFIALRLDDAGERKFRWRGWQAVEGLWTIENPETVTVHATEHDVKVEVGGVPFRGIVDRIDIDGDALVISDYKSGRAPTPRFADERLTQVLLYAAAVRELMGRAPSRARLLYLGQRIIEVDVTEENLGGAVAALGETWESLQSDCSNETFPATTGPLCAWCPFVSQCAEGTAEMQQRHAAGRVRLDAPGLIHLAEAG